MELECVKCHRPAPLAIGAAILCVCGGNIGIKKEAKMFEDAKVGDRVWSIVYGWGKIKQADVDIVGPDFKLEVEFLNSRDRNESHIYIVYTLEGKNGLSDKYPTLFWDEVKITPPPKPKKEVEVDIYMNIYKGDLGIIDGYKIWGYKSKAEADRSAGGTRLGEAIHIKHKYREGKMKRDILNRDQEIARLDKENQRLGSNLQEIFNLLMQWKHRDCSCEGCKAIEAFRVRNGGME